MLRDLGTSARIICVGLVSLSALSAGRQGKTTVTVVGVVIAADGSGPIADAAVSLWHNEDFLATAQTSVEGRFQIEAKETGSVVVRVARNGYLTAEYGAARPGAKGTPVVLQRSQPVGPLSIQLWRPADISGLIVSAQQRVLPQVRVSLLAVTPGPELSSTVRQVTTTDGSGQFRFHGLPPGKYLVEAIERPGFEPAARGASTTDGRALGRLVHAAVYFPGVARIDDAVAIDLAAGQSVGGISFQLAPVAAFSVSGVVRIGGSEPASEHRLSGEIVSVSAPRHGRALTVADSGHFRADMLPAGAYEVFVRADRRIPSSAQANRPLWCRRLVIVGSEDLTDVSVDCASGIEFRARLTEVSGFDANLPTVRLRIVPLRASLMRESVELVPSVKGDVRPIDVPPGVYRFVLTSSSLQSQSWSVESLTLNSIDVLGLPFELVESSPSSLLEVGLTDRPTELVGRLTDLGDRPALSYAVVVVAASLNRWRSPERRRVVRPATDGTFRILGLPPDSYMVAVVDAAESPDDSDSRAFERLAAEATIRVGLQRGKPESLSLRIQKEE